MQNNLYNKRFLLNLVAQGVTTTVCQSQASIFNGQTEPKLYLSCILEYSYQSRHHTGDMLHLENEKSANICFYIRFPKYLEIWSS